MDTENRNSRHILFNERPASFFGNLWMDASPLGNGETGALVNGGIRTEQICLTRHDLWHWGQEQELPDVSYTLRETRDAIDQGEYKRANRILSDALLSKSYDPQLAMPYPLGLIKIEIGTEALFCHYRRELDMENGCVCISYDTETNQRKCHYTRRAFVSRTDRIFVYQIRSMKPVSIIRISAELMDTGREDTKRMRKDVGDTLYSFTKDGMLFYGFRENGNASGMLLRVISGDGEIQYQEDSITVTGSREIMIQVKTFHGVREDEEREKAAEKLRNIKGDFESLFREHSACHRELYNRADVHIYEESPGQCVKSNEKLLAEAYWEKSSTELTEKLWHFGRYLFISGTAEDTNPFPLYGLWNGQYSSPWAQNVANENVEMIYWHTFAGGLSELVKPLIHYYFRKIPEMRENAAKLFGCSGIFVSTYTTPDNTYISPVVPVIANWIGAAGWLSSLFFDYYRYTGDEALLKKEILPFMKDAAAFYCDYVTTDRDGKLVIYPSVSPENSPANFIDKEHFQHLGHALPVVKNATMDFAIIKELLQNLLSVAEKAEIDPEETAVWKETLDRIPEYQINKDGAIREWMDESLDDQYYHRHLSHLYPLFPGHEITKNSEEKLYLACEKAVDLRELGGQVGWSLVHMAAIYSRLGRADDALKCLDTIPKGVLLPNFIMISNDYRSMGVTMDVGQFAPVQLDANMGYVNAVQEMLFRFDKDGFSFLPACPTRWKKGEVRGFCYPGGKVDFMWDMEKRQFSASVRSLDGKKYPWSVPVTLLPGNIKFITL